jgi:predicted HTH transcriptional regulator
LDVPAAASAEAIAIAIAHKEYVKMRANTH